MKMGRSDFYCLEGSDRKNDWLLECRAIYSRNHPGPNPLSSFLKKWINDRSTEGKEYQNWDAWTRSFWFHWLVGLNFWARSRYGRNIEGGRRNPMLWEFLSASTFSTRESLHQYLGLLSQDAKGMIHTLKVSTLTHTRHPHRVNPEKNGRWCNIESCYVTSNGILARLTCFLYCINKGISEVKGFPSN